MKEEQPIEVPQVSFQEESIDKATEKIEKFEFSFLLVKPNAVKTGLVDTIRDELLDEGLDIIGEITIKLDRRAGEIFYSSLGDKKDEIIDHLVSGDSHVFVMCGNGIIKRLRQLQGHTAWKDRPAAGLRGKYAFNHIENSTHCPDSHKEAVDEFNLVFPDIKDTLMQTQLKDELTEFLTDEESINSGERHLSTYAI